MFSALFKALAQLRDPRLSRVLKLGIAGALGAYCLLVAVIWVVLAKVHLFTSGWADWGADLAVGALALVLPLLFLPALATTLMGPMLDGVAQAVEERHYPGLSPAREQPWGEVVAGTLRFFGLTVALNLAALPVYGILLFSGLTLVLATVLNGYLLGREYFELVALRREDAATARQTFRLHLGRLWLGGAVIAVLFSLPLINLTAPVLGTAFMTHLYQSLRRDAKAL